MLDLLNSYSLSDILIFTIFLALAIKSLITFFDWAYERLKRIFDKENSKLNRLRLLLSRLLKGSLVMKALLVNQLIMETTLKDLSLKITMLILSDKDAIKSYITRLHHHFCYLKQWIDDFSLDCILKRYKHYQDEGGNTFIEGFMLELRDLPKQNLLLNELLE